MMADSSVRAEDNREAAVAATDAARAAGRSPLPVWTPVNPLLAAAMPLLLLVEDSRAERARLQAALDGFVAEAAHAGADVASVKAGRIALALLVEDRLGVRFGDLGADPGGRLRERLDALVRAPDAFRAEIELLCVCLALGLDGPWRGRPGGRDPDRVRSELYRILRRLRGPVDPALSPQRPSPARRPFLRLPARWPAWMGVLLALTAAAGWYVLSSDLAGRAEAVAHRLTLMLSAPSSVVHRGPPPVSAAPGIMARVAQALEPEIQTRMLTVLAGTDGALVVRLAANGMFPIDGDAMSARVRALVDRVASVLAPEGGRIAVVGHLDDVFSPSDRFPTPEALTLARAEAVRRGLEARIPAARITAIGRGAAEPVSLNVDSSGRTLNRRIDIRVYPF